MWNDLRDQIRQEMAVALRVHAPSWLVDDLAAALGELAALQVHHHSDRELAQLESQVRAALATFAGWKRSQGLIAA